MGFRDQDLASQERTVALEREIERLKAENAALKERPEPTARPRKASVGRWAAPLGIVALLLGAAALLAPGPLRVILPMVAFATLMMAVQFKVLGSLLHVVEPGELLVLSGVATMGPDGERRGYRLVTSGRVLRKPIVETATWMALGPFPFTFGLRRLVARRDRIDLRASATIAISTAPGVVENAVERFLGWSKDEIVEVARQTIEGTVREVVANLSLQELQEDAPAIGRKIRDLLQSDLEKLGLELPTLVLQDVSLASED